MALFWLGVGRNSPVVGAEGVKSISQPGRSAQFIILCFFGASKG